MEWVTEKWGGHPHYRGEVHHLGDDDHGSWYWGPLGCPIRRGDTVLFERPQPLLTVASTDAWWSPAWLVGHPEIDVYVNIATPVVREPDRIVSVDLDLDVIRYRDGRVEVVDRDEFEEHQVRFGYPTEIIEATERATAEAFELVAAGAPPFDAATASTWIERAAG